MTAIAEARHRRGFSLIELMAIFGVIGILLALIVPAVQQAREAARSAQCKNQLKQFGIAFQTYHEMHRVFPMGSSREQSIGGSGLASGAWGYLTYLLPHLGERNAHQSLSFRSDNCCLEIMNLQSDGRFDASSHFFPFVNCPSDPKAGNLHTTGLKSLICGKVRPGSYLGISGNIDHVCSGTADGNGLLFTRSSISLTSVRDGASHTFLLGERAVDLEAKWGWLICGGNECEHYLSGEHPIAKITAERVPANQFSSWHKQSVHFLTVDGAVRAASLATDVEIIRRMSSRSGGENIGL